MITSRVRTRVALVVVHLFIAVALWVTLAASGCSSSNSTTPQADASTSDIVTGDQTAGNCSKSQTSCGGACVNTTNDPKNCGSCGATCSGGLDCANGTCTVGCPTGQMLCGVGSCVNTQNDYDNCGACAKQCQPGQVCSSGMCSQYCGTGLTSCGTSCVDEQTDNNNCGACGKACATGLVCSGGNCGVSCGLLTSCTTDAGTYCSNTQTDNANCGTCGNACPAGEACSGGQCDVTCQSGLVNCNGTCINPSNDPTYCGASGACGAGDSGSVGTTCGAGQACGGGVCAISCPPGQVACNGTCVDPKSNGTYCGATPGCGLGDAGTAGTTCPGGQLCSAGTCQSSCAQNLVPCNVNGTLTCIDPSTNSQFCGATTGCNADAGTAGQACPSGEICAGGACSVSCLKGTIECPGTGGICIDPTSNPTFCGASGNCTGVNAGITCGAGAICSNGNCLISCVPGQVDCQNQCINPNSNNQFCGANLGCTTYTTCASGQVCNAGQCQLSCQAGLVNCNGQCINPLNNLTYCGASANCTGYMTCDPGKVCTGGNDAGVQSTCQLSCLNSEVNCGGICIDPQTDSQNCGAMPGGNCMSPTMGTNYEGQNCAATVGGSTCNGFGACACPTSPLEIACVNGTLCIDPSSNQGYCGAKGNCTNTGAGNSAGTNCASTAGQSCVGSACTCPSIPGTGTQEPVCLVGVNPTCVDPTSNNTFCGATGNCTNTGSGNSAGINCATISGSTCVNVGGTPLCVCPLGQINCNSKCIDPTANNQFCGAAGNCTNSGAGNSAGSVCSPDSLTTCGLQPASNPPVYYCEPTCVPASQPTTGQLACSLGTPDAACVSYQTDKFNCGNCGVACGAFTACGPDASVTPPNPGDLAFGCNGTCASGQTACLNITAPTCTNLSTDPNNCGSGAMNPDGSVNGCGNVCDAGLKCSSGVCTGTCGAPDTLCGTACVNLNNDPNNCGACSNACGGGSCLPTGATPPAQCCGAQFDRVCPGTGSDGGTDYNCKSTTNDRYHCGSCPNACTGHKTCVNSQCFDLSTGQPGPNEGWNDGALPGTYTSSEALTACQTWETANSVSGGCTSAASLCPGFSGVYDHDAQFIWWFAAAADAGTAVTPGEVTAYTCNTTTAVGTWY